MITQNKFDRNENPENSDSSDVSMSSDSDFSSDSESESEESVHEDKTTTVPKNGEGTNGKHPEGEDDDEEEEDDEVVKAIIRAKGQSRDRPPNIITEDHIVDISFHPQEDLIAVALITGDVLMYKYSNEENSLLYTWELHVRACRDVEFDSGGKLLFSTGKDRVIMVTDVATGKLVQFRENCHEVPVYCLRVLDEHLLASGDDDGAIKVWDLRQQGDKSVFTVKKNEDYISDMISNEEKKMLVCSSGDGTLTTIDLRNRQYKLQSEDYDEELTSLGLFRHETKLLAGSSKGKMFLFNWPDFGLHSDEFPGPKSSINRLIPITENIVVTGCEDGILRATHLFPHRHLGIVGQHEMSVECLDISNDGSFIASSSHGGDIQFWNIEYFEDFDRVDARRKQNKRKSLQNNLPSSRQKNAADFFTGLTS